MAKRISVDAAKKVVCPHCNAQVGQPCNSISGGGIMRTVVHIARKRALVAS
jgi:hypothetical protein